MTDADEAQKLRMQHIIVDFLSVAEYITEGMPLPNVLTAAEEFIEMLRTGEWQLERLNQVPVEALQAELARRQVVHE